MICLIYVHITELCVYCCLCNSSFTRWLSARSPSVTASQKSPTVKWLLTPRRGLFCAVDCRLGQSKAPSKPRHWDVWHQGCVTPHMHLYGLGIFTLCAQLVSERRNLIWKYLNTFFFLDVPNNCNLFSDRLSWLWLFNVTWRNKQDVSSLFLHGDILRDNHSMFENPTLSLMPLQARVQFHVVWHLKWTRLADYQTLFSDDKHVDLCGVIYAISWMVWVLMDTELCQHITHLCPLHYQGQTEPSSDKNRN